MQEILLSVVMLFAICIPIVTILLALSVMCNWKDYVPKKNKFASCASRFEYKAFLKNIKENGLLANTLTMDYNQIISLLNVPELNIQYDIVDAYRFTPKEDNGLLLIYTFKDEQMYSPSFCIHSEKARKENGLILFVPKTYKDYRNLCYYFANNDISKTNDNIVEEQMKSLKYLTDLIHQAQDKHTKTLQDCQLEMDRELDSEFLKSRRNM